MAAALSCASFDPGSPTAASAAMAAACTLEEGGKGLEGLEGLEGCRPTASAAGDEACVIGSRADPGYGPAPHSVREALWQLMNNPHPLDILAASTAYGTSGSISRWVP